MHEVSARHKVAKPHGTGNIVIHMHHTSQCSQNSHMHAYAQTTYKSLPIATFYGRYWLNRCHRERFKANCTPADNVYPILCSFGNLFYNLPNTQLV